MLFTACRKEELIPDANDEYSQLTSKRKLKGVPNCNATVENGILHFETREDLNTYNQFIRNLNPEKLEAIEESNNFISYGRLIDDILNEYARLNGDETKTKEELLNFRKEKLPYLTISDSDFVENIHSPNPFIINSEGYVEVADIIEKHGNNVIVSTLIENKDQFQNNTLSKDKIYINKIIELDINDNPKMKLVQKYGNTGWIAPKYRCGGRYDNKKTKYRVKWFKKNYPYVFQVFYTTWGSNSVRYEFQTWFEIEVKNYSRNYRFSWWYSSPRKTIINGQKDAWFKYNVDNFLPNNFFGTYSDTWISTSYIRKNYNDHYFSEILSLPAGVGYQTWKDNIKDNSWMYVDGNIQVENCPGQYETFPY